jgi:hypothetical protein
MKNEKLQMFVEKAKVFFTHAGKIAIIGAAMIFGFIVCDVYHRITDKEKHSTTNVVNLKNVHKLDETSVAINERNELLIIDRKTGTYEIYQDSIGNMIFSLYAGKIYSNTVAAAK